MQIVKGAYLQQEWEKYSVETKLSDEYRKLYHKLWKKYNGKTRINLADKSTWDYIPDEEFHIMLLEPPLKDYGYFIAPG